MNDTESKSGGKNRSLSIFLAIILLVALLAGGYYYYTSRGGDIFGSFKDTEQPEGSGPVARVDGVEIGREEYDRNLEQTTGMYAVQGMDTNDPNTANLIKEQVLNTLINRQLILATAQKSDIEVTESDIDAEYQTVLTSVGGEEALNTALSSNGLTMEDLRTDLRNGILIQKYLDTRVGINNAEVTDEEVRQYYDNAKEQGGEVPPFEDVSGLIRQQLLAEKQQQIVNTALEALRKEANIEILI